MYLSTLLSRPDQGCEQRAQIPHQRGAAVQRMRLSSLVVIAALMLSACTSGEDESTPRPSSSNSTSSGPSSSGSTPSPEEPAAPTVEVRIDTERVTPNADQVDLSVGESLTFEIVSDRAGELHVHSKPEQYLEFNEGRTQSQVSIETPGSVKVEEHETGAVVAIVEVR
jgi:hypothetical protein